MQNLTLIWPLGLTLLSYIYKIRISFNIFSSITFCRIISSGWYFPYYSEKVKVNVWHQLDLSSYVNWKKTNLYSIFKFIEILINIYVWCKFNQNQTENIAKIYRVSVTVLWEIYYLIKIEVEIIGSNSGDWSRNVRTIVLLNNCIAILASFLTKVPNTLPFYLV